MNDTVKGYELLEPLTTKSPTAAEATLPISRWRLLSSSNTDPLPRFTRYMARVPYTSTYCASSAT